MRPILVAGIGNILEGDDGWGCEVARRLSRGALPREVEVVDFGIRGVDLAYALIDEFRAAVLVGAARRGGSPGDVRLIEPAPPTGMITPEDLTLPARELDPARVLRFARALDGTCEHAVLVACEPQNLGENGEIGLTEPVRQAVERGVELATDAVLRMLGPARSEAPPQPMLAMGC